jgi:hypothetical protein
MLASGIGFALSTAMATPKKNPEATITRVAARPAQAERRVETTRETVRNEPSYDAVSRRAFELWVQSGHQDGQDVQHWLQAEAELRGVR